MSDCDDVRAGKVEVDGDFERDSLGDVLDMLIRDVEGVSLLVSRGERRSFGFDESGESDEGLELRKASRIRDDFDRL